MATNPNVPPPQPVEPLSTPPEPGEVQTTPMPMVMTGNLCQQSGAFIRF